MQTKQELSAPLNHKSSGIVPLMQRLIPSHCRVTNFSNEVVLDLTNSGFTVIGDDVLSTQCEVIFQRSEIDRVQFERAIDASEDGQLWIMFSTSSLIEISLISQQTDEFWNLIRCLELDREVYVKQSCKDSITGKCPCCIKRAEIIRAETHLHPVAFILSEIADGLAGSNLLLLFLFLTKPFQVCFA